MRIGTRSWLLIAALLATFSGCKCQRTSEAEAEPAGEAESAAAQSERAEANAQRLAELPVRKVDLDGIDRAKTLRILIDVAEERLLTRRGSPTTEERALLAEFARRRGLEPQFVVADSFDQLFPLLLEGKADVIAADLTVTKERRKRVAFTRPVETVTELVVGRRGAKDLPKKPGDLSGREVHVRGSSSFADSLRGLQDDGIDVKLVAAPESLDPEALVYEVTRGRRPLTVVDSHLLEAIASYNPDAEGLFPIAEGRQIAWAVRKDSPKLKAALDAFIFEHALTQHTEEIFVGDLAGIRKRGALRMITRNNPVTYFLHRGAPFGFDYELMKLAAEELGVRLEVVVAPSRAELIPYLLEGKGDVIAASLTVTPERSARVRFSRPYLLVDEVLVKRRGDPTPLATLAELRGKQIHVRRSSSYFDTLKALQQQYGPFEVVEAPEGMETEELIDQVAHGEVPLTVADSHILQAELAYHDEVEAAFPLRDGKGEPSRQLAFAVRPGNEKLGAFLDRFVKKHHRGLRYNMARKRYFENRRRITQAHDERAGRTGRLSAYDEIFKKYGARYGLDWRLLAAQAHQESQFDPNAESWVGAQGLFQVMPATGAGLGFERLRDPDEGSHAGVLYLSQLVQRIDPTLEFKQRVRFALAAYNAGLGHVLDARRLAAERGLDPDRWFGHVEKAMLLLEKPQFYKRARHGYCRGSEPVKYVSEIQARYDLYVKLLDGAEAPEGEASASVIE